jgi:hypothetical protein
MYLASLPNLDDNSKRALSVIQKLGVVPGFQLMSEASLNGIEMVQAAGNLIKYGFISASGPVSNANEIGSAYFNIRPSSRDLTDVVLNSQ